MGTCVGNIQFRGSEILLSTIQYVSQSRIFPLREPVARRTDQSHTCRQQSCHRNPRTLMLAR